MSSKTSVKIVSSAVLLTVMALSAAPVAAGVDAGAARALARKDSCMRCHALAKKKEGPSYQAIAYKYKGDANALELLVKHISVGDKVRLSDGHEEAHKIAKARNEDEVRNLIAWILQQ